MIDRGLPGWAVVGPNKVTCEYVVTKRESISTFSWVVVHVGVRAGDCMNELGSCM